MEYYKVWENLDKDNSCEVYSDSSLTSLTSKEFVKDDDFNIYNFEVNNPTDEVSKLYITTLQNEKIKTYSYIDYIIFFLTWFFKTVYYFIYYIFFNFYNLFLTFKNYFFGKNNVQLKDNCTYRIKKALFYNIEKNSESIPLKILEKQPKAFQECEVIIIQPNTKIEFQAAFLNIKNSLFIINTLQNLKVPVNEIYKKNNNQGWFFKFFEKIKIFIIENFYIACVKFIVFTVPSFSYSNFIKLAILFLLTNFFRFLIVLLLRLSYFKVLNILPKNENDYINNILLTIINKKGLKHQIFENLQYINKYYIFLMSPFINFAEIYVLFPKMTQVFFSLNKSSLIFILFLFSKIIFKNIQTTFFKSEKQETVKSFFIDFGLSALLCYLCDSAFFQNTLYLVVLDIIGYTFILITFKLFKNLQKRLKVNYVF